MSLIFNWYKIIKRSLRVNSFAYRGFHRGGGACCLFFSGRQCFDKAYGQNNLVSLLLFKLWGSNSFMLLPNERNSSNFYHWFGFLWISTYQVAST
jgi:hypothetical protein